MSTYKTNMAYVLYTVIDNKLLNKLSKQYKKEIDKLFNEEESIKVRNMRTKIGKEYLIKEEDDLPEEFDIHEFIEENKNMLKHKGLTSFLQYHGWTMTKLCDYITKTNSILKPVTEITF